MIENSRRLGPASIATIAVCCAFWGGVLIIAPMSLMVDQAFRPFLSPKDWGGPLDLYTLENFKIVLFNPFNRNVFLKTIWGSLLVTVTTIALAYPVSYFLARTRRSGVGLSAFMVVLLIPFWVNEVLRTFAWQLLLARNGLFNLVLTGLGVVDEPIQFLNQDVGVTIGLTYTYILFMVFPLYNAMESLDSNQIEAARDLGAPLWRVHWDIVIPHAKPGIVSGCVIVFMLASGSHVVPALLGGTRSLWFSQLIYGQFDAINWNAGAAYGLTLTVLCLSFILLMMWIFRVDLKDIAK